MNEIVSKVQMLLAKDRLEEAIDLIIVSTLKLNTNILFEAIVLSREIYGLKKMDVCFDDLNRNRNRISLGILNLLKNINEDSEHI